MLQSVNILLENMDPDDGNATGPPREFGVESPPYVDSTELSGVVAECIELRDCEAKTAPTGIWVIDFV